MRRRGQSGTALAASRAGSRAGGEGHRGGRGLWSPSPAPVRAHARLCEGPSLLAGGLLAGGLQRTALWSCALGVRKSESEWDKIKSWLCADAEEHLDGTADFPSH